MRHTNRLHRPGRASWFWAALLIALGAGTSSLFTQSLQNCTFFRFNPPAASFPAAGGTGSVGCDKGTIFNGVYTGCAWTASSNVPWIAITSGETSSLAGFGVVQYTVQPNGLASGRSGTITFSSGSYGSAIYTISQAGIPGPLTVSPSSLSFNSQLGQAPAATQRLNISTSGPSLPFSVGVTSSGAWLAVNPVSGLLSSTPLALTVAVSTTNLSSGTYAGSIVISSGNVGSDSGGFSTTVPVSLTISDPSARPLIVPKVLTFRYNLDQPNALPPPQPIAITSRNGVSTVFTVAPSAITPAGRSWISVDKTGGVTPTTVNVTVDPRGLGPGRYLAQVRYGSNPVTLGAAPPLKAGGSREAIDQDQTLTAFILNVGPQSPLIVTPDDLTFDDTSSTSQRATVAGFRPFLVTPYAMVMNGTGAWLSVNPPGPATTDALFTVSAGTAGFAPRQYRGMIAFADSAGTTGSVITVEANVGSQSGIAWATDKDALAFSQEIGGTAAAAQNIAISNPSVNTAAITTQSDGGWLSVQTPTSVPGILAVTVQPVGLAVGTYAGSISVSAPGATAPPLEIPVSLTVTNPPFSTLNRPLMSQIVDGGGWKTTITLVNTDTVPATFTLNFWQDDGSAMRLPLEGLGRFTQYSDTIPVGGSRTIASAEDASPSQGWAELITTRSIGGLAIFRQQVAGRPNFEAASPLGPNAGGRFVLPFDNTQQFVTSMALVNPLGQASSVTVVIRGEDGTLLSRSDLQLAAHAHTAFRLDERFAASRNRRGLAEFTSQDSGLGGLGLRFNPGGAFTSLPVITSRDLSDTLGRRLIAQIADGQFWKTTVILVNGDTSTGGARVGFFRGDGAGLPFLFDQLGLTSVVLATAASDGILSFSTAGTAASLSQGWAELAGSPGLRGVAIFRQKLPGLLDFEAAAPTVTNISSSFLLPFDNTQSFVTSMSLINPSPFPATISVRLRDENGVLISSTSIDLGPRGHAAFVFKDQFPGVTNRRGVAEFSSPTGVTGLGLRFTSGTGGAFTSLPILPR